MEMQSASLLLLPTLETWSRRGIYQVGTFRKAGLFATSYSYLEVRYYNGFLYCADTVLCEFVCLGTFIVSP